MQTYSAANTLKYRINRQGDVGIGDGRNASAAAFYLSLSKFNVKNLPKVIKVPDAQGNRSAVRDNPLSNRDIAFTMEGTTEVRKLGLLLYYATGGVDTVPDESTGAYEHTFTPQNQVILPEFKMFYPYEGEDDGVRAGGYKTAKGCVIGKIAFNIDGEKADFRVEGMALSEVDDVDLASTISSLTAISAVYQSNGLIRVTFSGTPTLTDVKNGDVFFGLNSSGFANTENKVNATIVNIKATGLTGTRYVDIINPLRSDNTKDETSITATGCSIKVLNTPEYSEADGYVMQRYGSVREAYTTGAIADAECFGLRNWQFELQNNLEAFHEDCNDQDALVIIAKEVNITCSFEQLSRTPIGARLMQFKEGNGSSRVWDFKYENTSVLLGTSTTYHPLLEVIFEALGLADRNDGAGDAASLAWTLYSRNEQDISIKLRNTEPTYPIT